MLTALVVLNVAARLKEEGKTISEYIAELDKYATSGEVNFKIENKAEVMEKLKNYFFEQKEPVNFYDFDGYRLEYNDWWFNVRPSNTEPYLRLVVEAKTETVLDEKLAEIKEVMAVD
jgi:phosphomannomutase